MGLAYKSGSTPIPEHLYTLFPVLQQMLKRRGGDLSGGQQQQLAIARALAPSPSPSLLILDEPTEGIQPSIIKNIGRVIRQLADHGLDGHPVAVLLCCCAAVLLCCCAAVRAVLRLCRGTGRGVPGDGARRSHRPRAGQRDARKGDSAAGGDLRAREAQGRAGILQFGPELRKVIGAQRKARAAAPTGAMGKGRNAALRAEDDYKPTLKC